MLFTFLFVLLLSLSALAQQKMVSTTDPFGNHLSVQMNTKTGSAHRVYGQLPNIKAFGFQRNNLSKATIRKLSSKFFSDYRNILKINPAQTKLRKANTDGKLWFVSYSQAVDSVPVYGTEIGYTVNQTGDIVALGADTYQNLRISTTPGISNKAALAVAEKVFGIDSVKVLDPGSLTIYPVTTDTTSTFYLAWKVVLFNGTIKRGRLLCRCGKRRNCGSVQ